MISEQTESVETMEILEQNSVESNASHDDAGIPSMNLDTSQPISTEHILDLEPSQELKVPPKEDVTAPDLAEDTTASSQQIQIKYAALTDVGRLRDHNEDGFRCFTQTMVAESHNQGRFETTRSLFVLCDGMGGHAGGEVASAMALDAIAESFKPFWTAELPGEQKLREIIANANQTIFNLNDSESRREAGRMGTTLLILATCNNNIAIAHVGDSRIYQITATGIQQLTRDHEVAIQLIDQGMAPEIALARPDAHQLTQALGPNTNQYVNPDLKFFRIETPSLFLLCSDGLCDNDVVEKNWQEYLHPLLASDSNLNDGIERLVQLGNSLNGYDNITAIAINCQLG